MKRLRQVWRDVRHGENIELYVAAPIAILLAIVNVIGVDAIFGVETGKWITSITLIILSIIASALLINRRTMEELSEKIGQSANTMFMEDLPESFEKDFQEATDLWLVGVSLTTIIRLHYSILEKKLNKGHSVKALVVQPNSPAVEMAEVRAYTRTSIVRANTEIQNSLQDLCNLKQITSGKLEIRTINHPLGHGTIAINPGSTTGLLYIQNYPYKTEGGSRPKFIIRAGDGQWYDFYKKELDNLWNNANEWDCNQPD
jgi:hypothetical protein